MTWPRLSTTLAGEKHPFKCQNCGRGGAWDVSISAGSPDPPCDVIRWQEHDDHDQCENVIVVLCGKCSKMIKPHPRLYRRLQAWEPFPGSNTICVSCRFRDGTSCTHPDLKANGGNGLELTFPKPHGAFVCRRGGKGGYMLMYQGDVKDCAGREKD